jgi:hypothetical protein
MDLNDMIKEDLNMNCTPDLPELRYKNEVVYVFLWDALADEDNFKSKLLDPKKYVDWVPWYSAITVNNYSPFYECSGESDVEAYCLEDGDDITYLEDHEDVEMMPVMGKLYKVSLDTLMNLDWHYENGYSYNRVVIDVVEDVYGSCKVRKCYAYMHDIDHIAEFDTQKSVYVLRNDLSLINFGTAVTGTERKEVYKFG